MASCNLTFTRKSLIRLLLLGRPETKVDLTLGLVDCRSESQISFRRVCILTILSMGSFQKVAKQNIHGMRKQLIGPWLVVCMYGCWSVPFLAWVKSH